MLQSSQPSNRLFVSSVCVNCVVVRSVCDYVVIIAYTPRVSRYMNFDLFENHVDLGGRERNDVEIFVGVRDDVHSPRVRSCLR